MSEPLHTKYRPKNLDEVIGHEKAVASLKGMIKKDSFPSAILFTGPPSVGKTTLARAFAASTFGTDSVKGHIDLIETNAADKRTIDDVRELIQNARYSPQRAKRKFIIVDEFQNLLSNPTAVAAFLKSLEEPGKHVTWLLASMDPDKFSQSTNGKAILTRCIRIHLEQHTDEQLKEFAIRIIKGEKFSYHTKETVVALVENCNSEARTLAQLIESTDSKYVGENKTGKIEKSYIDEIIQATESADDVTAVRMLTALFDGKMQASLLACLDVVDGFAFLKKLLWMNQYVLSNAALKDRRHPKVWANKHNLALLKNIKSLEGYEDNSAILRNSAIIHQEILQLVREASTFQVSEVSLLLGFCAKVSPLIKSQRK